MAKYKLTRKSYISFASAFCFLVMAIGAMWQILNKKTGAWIILTGIALIIVGRIFMPKKIE